MSLLHLVNRLEGRIYRAHVRKIDYNTHSPWPPRSPEVSRQRDHTPHLAKGDKTLQLLWLALQSTLEQVWSHVSVLLGTHGKEAGEELKTSLGCIARPYLKEKCLIINDMIMKINSFSFF